MKGKGGSGLSTAMALLRLSALCAAVASASAFAPAGMAGLRLKSGAAVARRPAATAPKMSLDAVDGAVQLLATAQNVPFVDEVTGEPQGFTAPLNHFASVSSLFCLLPDHSCAARREWRRTAPQRPKCATRR